MITLSVITLKDYHCILKTCLLEDFWALIFVSVGLAGAIFNLIFDSLMLVSLYSLDHSHWFTIFLISMFLPGIFVVGLNLKPIMYRQNWTWENLRNLLLICQPLNTVFCPIAFFCGQGKLVLKVN